MKRVVPVQVVRRRGRPRLAVPNVRVECMVPRTVLEQLVREEQAGHGYRTRVAASVLCEWATAKSTAHHA